MFISRETLDDVLLALYPVLLGRSNNTVAATRGENAEIIGALIEIEQPRARLSRSETRGKLFSSLGELVWYLSRSNRLDFIERYVPRYREESEDGVGVYGGYGPRLFGQRGHDQVRNVIDRADRLRLSILDVHGDQPERSSWEDEEGAPLETRVTEIAVELIATAEINYREACLRRHVWVTEKRDDLRARMDQERRVAEATALASVVAVEKRRLDNLLGMASDYRQARAIRLFVAAIRRRLREAEGTLNGAGLEDWCRWALAQADELDPAKNLAKFSLDIKQEK
jgi:hypothetical protein